MRGPPTPNFRLLKAGVEAGEGAVEDQTAVGADGLPLSFVAKNCGIWLSPCAKFVTATAR
jgi:hypothetical protein